MPSSLAHAARQQLESSVGDQASLRDLWVWLMSNVVVTQADQADADLRAVLGDTILYLFEYTGGHIDEGQVRRYVAGLLAPVRAS